MHWALFVRYYKHLVIGSIDGNVICNNFEYRLIVSANFNQAKTTNIFWFRLLECDGLVLFSVFYHFKLNIFSLWTVGRTKQDV